MNSLKIAVQVLCLSLILAQLASSGCAPSTQVISEPEVEQKLARIVVGQTTKGEVEALLGTAKPKEPNFWVYNIADTATEYNRLKGSIADGTIPGMPVATITNTRFLATLRFNPAGTVKGLEIARYFAAPYVNDYRYLVKGPDDKTLEAVASLAEASGFKVSALEKSAGTFTLEDTGSKARMAVKLNDQLLHIVSTNPYDRASNQYRAYTKREIAFTESIATADFFQ
jgi:hypothetical protein